MEEVQFRNAAVFLNSGRGMVFLNMLCYCPRAWLKGYLSRRMSREDFGPVSMQEGDELRMNGRLV